jgi:hypothetical protein
VYQFRKKNLADIVAIYGQGRELFRPPTYNLVIFDLIGTKANKLHKEENTLYWE